MLRKYATLLVIAVVITSFCIGSISTDFQSRIWNSLKSITSNSGSVSWDDSFQVIEILSSKDSTIQYAYFLVAKDGERKKPLLVSLHAWSGTYTQHDPLAAMARDEGWNYIHPDFRGPNTSIDACLSLLALTDIDDAIQYAIDHGNVDVDNIFVVGVSGGGYATLGSYMRTRHSVKAFMSWAAISDLSAWYYQSVSRQSQFARDILMCTTGGDIPDEMAMRSRSPLYWKAPDLPRGILELYAGINDGYNGSVPISHSILFYNRIVGEFGDPASLVDEFEAFNLLTRATEYSTQRTIGSRRICFERQAPMVSLTIFEGGHEILAEYCFERLILISKSAATD